MDLGLSGNVWNRVRVPSPELLRQCFADCCPRIKTDEVKRGLETPLQEPAMVPIPDPGRPMGPEVVIILRHHFIELPNHVIAKGAASEAQMVNRTQSLILRHVPQTSAVRPGRILP